jgi:hypothetical protein
MGVDCAAAQKTTYVQLDAYCTQTHKTKVVKHLFHHEKVNQHLWFHVCMCHTHKVSDCLFFNQ